MGVAECTEWWQRSKKLRGELLGRCLDEPRMALVLPTTLRADTLSVVTVIATAEEVGTAVVGYSTLSRGNTPVSEEVSERVRTPFPSR